MICSQTTLAFNETDYKNKNNTDNCKVKRNKFRNLVSLFSSTNNNQNQQGNVQRKKTNEMKNKNVSILNNE